VISLTTSPGSGDLNAGKVVTFTVTLGEPVTITGANPSLSLNDGETAFYTGGSGHERADVPVYGRKWRQHPRSRDHGGQ
jgi:hypothetical protein